MYSKVKETSKYRTKKCCKKDDGADGGSGDGGSYHTLPQTYHSIFWRIYARTHLEYIISKQTHAIRFGRGGRLMPHHPFHLLLLFFHLLTCCGWFQFQF